jgi:urease accessory protein
MSRLWFRIGDHLQLLEQEPPWKVVRAFQNSAGESLVHLHNISGGILGGDRLNLKVDVAANARAQLTSTGATRIYRRRSGFGPSSQTCEFTVAEGARLEYLPDPLIPYAESDFEQQTRIELKPGAGLFWWETVTPGRQASGELFDYDLLRIHVDITVEAQPIARERLRLEPKLRPLDSLARLGRFLYFATFYIVRAGWDAARWQNLETQLSDMARQWSRPGEILWGASTLPAHGVVVRCLSLRGRDIPPGLMGFWRAAKMEIFGEDAVPPRKIY